MLIGRVTMSYITYRNKSWRLTVTRNKETSWVKMYYGFTVGQNVLWFRTGDARSNRTNTYQINYLEYM